MKLSKKHMILLTMLEMNSTTKNILIYEDIVVKTYEKYPEVFHLKGYKHYPDTVILMRELYNLVPEGFVRIKKRQCVFTDLGLHKALEIKGELSNRSIKSKSEKDLNLIRNKILKILNLQGFKLFIEGDQQKILDVDFYEFFETSVRTSRIEVTSNIKQTNTMIKLYSQFDKKLSSDMIQYSNFLIKSFPELMNK